MVLLPDDARPIVHVLITRSRFPMKLVHVVHIDLRIAQDFDFVHDLVWYGCGISIKISCDSVSVSEPEGFQFSLRSTYCSHKGFYLHS